MRIKKHLAGCLHDSSKFTQKNAIKIICFVGLCLLSASIYLKNRFSISKEAKLTKIMLSQSDIISEFFFDEIPFYELPPEISLPGSEIPFMYAEDVPSSELNVRYILLPNAISYKNLQNNFITFFVKSTATHFFRRKMIRETWGSITAMQNYHILVIFLVGSASESVNTAVKKENDCHQDILQTSIMDSFETLTKKTLSAFKWIKNKMKHKSLFYIFTDDDCVIDLYETVSFLKRKTNVCHPKINCIYCGFAYENDLLVTRNTSKMSVSNSQYPSAVYPAFCHGVMVILTYETIKNLYEVSTKTNYAAFPLEDVMVYGILRSKLKTQKLNIFPVINGAHKLALYSWDNSANAVKKMSRQWFILNKYTYRDRKPPITKKNFNIKSCLNYIRFISRHSIDA